MGQTINDLEIKAYKFACIAHSNQFRKDGITPYIVHPCQVVSILKMVGIIDSRSISVAYLHDVIEDTDNTYENILEEFGKDIADDVLWLTQLDCESKDAYFERISKAPIHIRNIKLADRIANLRNIKYDGWNPEWFDSYTGKTRKYFTEWTSGTNEILFKILQDILEKPYVEIVYER